MTELSIRGSRRRVGTKLREVAEGECVHVHVSADKGDSVCVIEQVATC